MKFTSVINMKGFVIRVIVDNNSEQRAAVPPSAGDEHPKGFSHCFYKLISFWLSTYWTNSSGTSWLELKRCFWSWNFLFLSWSQSTLLKVLPRENVAVHLKVKIHWKCTHPQAIQDVDVFVSSCEQMKEKCSNGSSAVNGCRQNESPNSW